MKRLFYTSEKTDNRVFQWICWFQPSDGWLLLDDETNKGRVILDTRYADFPLESDQRELNSILASKKILEHLSDIVTSDELISLESSLPYAIVQKLEAPDQEHNFLFAYEESSWQEQHRTVKSTDKIAHITQAIELTHQLWEWLEEVLIKSWDIVWMTEQEVRGRLIWKAFELWLEGEAFDTIVAYGANSAIPHHHTGKTVIGTWPLLVDMWWRVHWWCSDFTRTVWVWEQMSKWADDKISEWVNEFEIFQEILSVVKKVHDEATSMCVAWASCAEIATAAREIISDAWYGEHFTHSLGHGIGLDVHEAPRVSIKSEDILEPGMVLTIEPGIYLPGKFGVRRENTIVIDNW